MEARFLEEGVDGGVVGIELAEEQTRVPPHEDVADVEDHGAGRGGHADPPGFGRER